VSQKVSHLMTVNNFGKCGSIFKILSPIDLGLHETSLCTHDKDFHIICNILLHYLVKVENLKCCGIFPQRVCVARTMSSKDAYLSACLSVRLSVRPSITRRYSVETVILKLCSPSGSHTILVFFTPNSMEIFRRGPPK